MDKKMALHSAARRFCEDRFGRWTERYGALCESGKGRVPHESDIGWDYSEEAYGVFPKYRLDEAIQIGLEKIIPQLAGSLEDLRSLFEATAQVAFKKLSAELTNPISQKALTSEIEEFLSYIHSLNDADLLAVRPLPHRRALSDEESKALWGKLKSRWDIGGGYWFPLRIGDPPPNLMAFHEEYFEEMDGTRLLREALASRDIDFVLQAHELGPADYEIELSLLSPRYGRWGEVYSTSEMADWVVYASHESSITLAGDWLVSLFKARCPDWRTRLYGGPHSTTDLRGRW